MTRTLEMWLPAGALLCSSHVNSECFRGNTYSTRVHLSRTDGVRTCAPLSSSLPAALQMCFPGKA
eukprot:CAMPEP_0196760880 /NCGR_PEP_ID=MMETSP1091-20130531/105464_1 /TAXON_ID=302021 /ORGANISM="Rhodomonas sp., Strain CCMP768" /LENGTH=64 /DNA_ID=CAMNT_0042109811 /DNA_START=474 /DNA_END=664 /DNA_ORIENTATION=-